MNRRQKIIWSISGIFVVLFILMGITYAYFLTQVNGNENPTSITISSAKLILTYGDGNGILEAVGDLVPNSDKLIEFKSADNNFTGTTTEKKFTVKNDGDEKIEDYGVVLENIDISYVADSITSKRDAEGNPIYATAGQQTSFEFPETLEITVTCLDNEGNRCTEEESLVTSLPNHNAILFENDIEAGVTHNYTLTMKFLDNGKDQSADMNKTFSGKINIIDTNNSVAIEGTVENYSEGDYIQINSNPKTSRIVFDEKQNKYTYRLIGVEPDEHTLSVYSKGSSTPKGSTKLSITKGKTESVSGNTITIVDDSTSATINIQSDYTFNIEPYLKGYKKLIDSVKVGDYVAYEYTPATYTTPSVESGKAVDASVIETFDSSSSAAITKWRVFSKANGVIQLLADIPSTIKLSMKESNGWKNGATVLNELSKTLYSGPYGEAKNINIDDINSATEIDLTGRYYYYDASYTKQFVNNSITIGELESTVSGLPTLNGTQILVSGASTLQDLKLNAYTYSYLDKGYTNSTATLETYYKSNPVWDMISTNTHPSSGYPYWVASNCLFADYDNTSTDGSWSPRVQYCHYFISSGSISNRYMTDSTNPEVTSRVYSIRPLVTLKDGLYGEQNSEGVWVISK